MTLVVDTLELYGGVSYVSTLFEAKTLAAGASAVSDVINIAQEIYSIHVFADFGASGALTITALIENFDPEADGLTPDGYANICTGITSEGVYSFSLPPGVYRRLKITNTGGNSVTTTIVLAAQGRDRGEKGDPGAAAPSVMFRPYGGYIQWYDFDAAVWRNLTSENWSSENLALVAGSIADVNVTSANIADVTTVAESIADVTTVAEYIADVSLAANVAIVAGIESEVATVAGEAANVAIVAGWLNAGGCEASNVPYDNSASGLEADDVQGAINEVAESVAGGVWESVTFTQEGAGAVERTVTSKLREEVSVLDFIPVAEHAAIKAGTSTYDCTSAIQAAIASGRPLNWLDGTYKITSELSFTVAGSLHWRSKGATIFYEPTAHTYSCMTISLPDGQHIIKGGLTLDVNQNANVGFKFVPEVNGADEPDLLLEDVSVVNTYRTTAFNDGDAILAVGSFRNVNIIRPIIKDCFMASGAGVVGVYGIFAITVSRKGLFSPRSTVIKDSWIENVYSDDATYLYDQDAIRVFSRYGGSGTGGLNNPNTVKIQGGFIKNVRGRSVKLQTENGVVSGLSLHRTKAAFGGVAGTLLQNADIEVQTGGVTVSDIEFQYEDFVPVRVVRCIQADETVRWASPSIVSDIRGVVTGSFAPDAVVLFTALTTATAIDSQFVCSDINVVSETAFEKIFAVNTLSGVSSALIYAAFANAICPVSGCGFQLSDNATVKNISIVNITNSRSPAVPLTNTEYALTLNVENISGFTGFSNEPYTRAVEVVDIIGSTDNYILTRETTTQTISLPDPATTLNRVLTFKNLGFVAVESAFANVVPFNSETAGVAIFGAGTAGTWLSMISDGTNWVVMQKS